MKFRRPTHPLYCTRNQKGNFKVGMRIEKSHLRRSLTSLQELMRQIRHLTIQEQVDNLNTVLRGHYAYYGIAGNIRALQKVYRAVERNWGARRFAPVAGQGTLLGRPSTRSKHGPCYCDQSCSFLIGGYRLFAVL